MAGNLKKHNPGCGCCDELQCSGLCDTNTVPQSITIDITGMDDDVCSNCEDVDGEIEHDYVSCIDDFSSNYRIHYENYSDTSWCGVAPNLRALYRGELFIYYYYNASGGYSAGDLRARYEINIGDSSLGWQWWKWDNAVSVSGSKPFNCDTLLSNLNFGSPTYSKTGTNDWCDPASAPTLTYVLG